MSLASDYSPVDPAIQADPYPYYAALRRGPSATYLEADELWVVPHFRSVWEVTRDPSSFSSKALRALGVGATSVRRGPRPDIRELDQRMARSLIATDPPDHTQMRRLVSRPFTPRAIANLAPKVRQICEALVDELIAASEAGSADLVAHLNVPLPVLVIAEALGIPAERREDFKRWSDALVGRLDGRGDTPENHAEIREMAVYFDEIVASRHGKPGDDLISWLVNGSDESGEPLGARDLVSFCTLLLIAGNETTTNLLGNAYQAFFHNPDQYELVCKTDNLGPVVEEVLRFDSSVQGILRLAETDVRIGDTTVPKDAVVMVLFASANRDESRWPDSEQFRVDREPLDHLGFGSGIHLCLGAHLARLEMTTAFDVFRKRIRSFELTAPPAPGHSVILRGYASMPVRVEAA
jgi:cytochrome P450